MNLSKKLQAIKVTNYNDFFYYPQPKKGLEELIIFPGCELNHHQRNIPNSSVWVFNKVGHTYDSSLLGVDLGCGVIGFKVPLLNYEEAAEMIAAYIQEKRVLGRGNHFIDLCTSIISPHLEQDSEHSILLIHTDGKQAQQQNKKQKNKELPQTIEEAKKRVSEAEEFREELGRKLADLLGVNSYCFGNWTHNSVDVCENKVIYRKGVIKTKTDEINLLLASLGREIFFYTVQKNYPLPFDSFPHGTGRKSALNETKVNEEKIIKLRTEVYIPKVIPNSSLSSEHPECYNDYKPIFEKLHHYLIGLGHADIKAYVGKI